MSGQEHSTIEEEWQSQVLKKPRIYYENLDDIPPEFRQCKCIDCGRSVAQLVGLPDKDSREAFFSLESGGIICRKCLASRFEEKQEPEQKRARPGISKQLRWSVFSRDKFTCVLCGATGVPLECDHIIPVSKGGATEGDNLQTLCEPCNRRKSCQVGL